MSERANLQRQIEELEQRFRELEQRVDDRSVLGIRQQLWLARTVGKVISEGSEEVEYPSGASSTFGIAFRRPAFTEMVGDQELEGPFGSEEPHRYALTVPKRYVPEGTDAMVVEIGGRFYFLPGGREVLIVQLDDDLTEASTYENDQGVTCIASKQQPATVWSFDDDRVLCPTEERVTEPEGVYNFETDKVHLREKVGSGDPNLLLIYREAKSGVWVPECGDCSDPTPTASVDCVCLLDEGLCQVFIHITGIEAINQQTQIGSPPNNTWPDYCQWLTVPDQGFGNFCGSGCILWSRVLGWELEEEVQPTSDCAWGMFQRGAISTPGGRFETNENYPCSSAPDVTGIAAYFFCPGPTDGTGTATVEIWLKGCLLMQLDFRDIQYAADTSPTPIGLETENRLTTISVPGADLSDPFAVEDRCHCLVESTRNEKSCGNFNASTSTPNLQHGVPESEIFGGGCYDANGDFNPTCATGLRCPGVNYAVNVAGSHDFGDGSVSLGVNDLVVYDDVTFKWTVIPAKAGGAVDHETFVPAEVLRFIDSDGCDWTRVLREAAIKIVFKACPP